MRGREGLRPPGATWALLAVALLATLSLKLLALADLNEGKGADVREGAAFLAQHRFRLVGVDRRSDPVTLDAVRGACVLRLYVVSPHGWHRQLLHELAGSRRLRFVYDGAVYADQPVWLTWSYYQWWTVNRLLGRRLPPRPVFGVAPSPQCGDAGVV